MQDFEIMQPTVVAICDSLVSEPEKWVFEINTFYHTSKFNCQKFWNNGIDPITETWMPEDTVFSRDQGRDIRNAYNTAKSITGSRMQQKLMGSNSKSIEPKTIEEVEPIADNNINPIIKTQDDDLIVLMFAAIFILIGVTVIFS